MDKNKPLQLVLKYKWFDMIKPGIKPEEYREIKPSIVSMLFDWKASGLKLVDFTERLKKERNESPLWVYFKHTHVTFYRGYSTDREKMTFRISNCSIGPAFSEWSDNFPGDVFVIDLEKEDGTGEI